MKSLSFSLIGCLLFSTAIFAQTDKIQNKLEVQGKPGMKFKAICIDADNAQEKIYEGTAPTEISIDVHLSKCRIERQDGAEEVSIRFSQKDGPEYRNKMGGGTLGMEFVIPLGEKKPKKGKK